MKHASLLDMPEVQQDSSPRAASPASSGKQNKQPNTAMTFTQRYFGMDGKGKVSYEQFADMVREMNRNVLKHKWMSMSPTSDGTVSLVRFADC